MLISRIITSILTGVVFAAAHPIRSSDVPEIIPNQWILSFKDDAPGSVFTSFQSHFRKRATGNDTVQVTQEYDLGQGSYRGFALTGPAEAVMPLNASEWIQDIIPDRWHHLADDPKEPLIAQREAQESADEPLSWNLDLISHKNMFDHNHPRPYNCPDGCGNGTYVYIIDSGVNMDHPEFAGRIDHYALPRGCPIPEDRNGHGTHVAGIAVGATHGIARNAKLIPVQIQCDGSNRMSTSMVLFGINFAIQHIEQNNRRGRAVINASLGTPKKLGSPDGRMLAKAVSMDIFVAVAAGNDRADANEVTPANEPSLCTVGSVGSSEEFWSHSNTGNKVDILAPGVDILSANHKDFKVPKKMTGTSMASPHVAGVAATLIASGNIGPKGVQGLCDHMKNHARLQRAKNVPSDTVDRVLFNLQENEEEAEEDEPEPVEKEDEEESQ